MNGKSRRTLFGSLLESCVNFQFYTRVLDDSLGRSFAYLTLLAAVAAISFTAYVYQIILPRLDKASDKLPTITITNGKVSFENQEGSTLPVTLYDDPGKILRIEQQLDGQQADRFASTDYDYEVVITRYSIVLKQLTGQVYTKRLPYGFSLTIPKNSLHFFIESWLWLILLVVFLFSFAFFWGLKLVHAFLMSVFGLVVWGILRRNLTYGKLMTLCIYALTPATLCTILILWLNTQFVLPRVLLEYQWLLYYLVAVEFLLGGLLAIQPPPPPPTNDQIQLPTRYIEF